MSNVVYLKPTEAILPASEPQLVFSNTGTLELDLVKLMGVSVKETADPIGFFGTGLKYAMATALRLGGEMTIFTNGQRYDVRGRRMTLRNKDFTQVMLNDEALGFTTELGKHWEAWMVVRELYSNALDEQGEVAVMNTLPTQDTLSGRTAIVLRGECFINVWNNRQQYFLSQMESRVHGSPFTDAFDALGHNHAVFYRGIKVFDTSLPTLYRYNLLEDVTLTEDRTLRYEFQLKEAIEKSIITSSDTSFITTCLMAGEYSFEHYLGFSDSHSEVQMSKEFKSVCRKLGEQKPRNLNMKAIRWYEVRAKTFQPVLPVNLTKVQQAQLDKAIAFIKEIGFIDFDNHEIIVTNWLGEGIYGQAKDGRSYISKECFDKGTKFLASTLLEEFVHNRYGLNDESRALQTWLFDRIITMGEEHVTGEPL
jgi:hypothetical protein